MLRLSRVVGNHSYPGGGAIDVMFRKLGASEAHFCGEWRFTCAESRTHTGALNVIDDDINPHATPVVWGCEISFSSPMIHPPTLWRHETPRTR